MTHMTTRPWFTVNTRGFVTGVQYLTDEDALARLERGEHLIPVGGEKRLLEELSHA